jgi:hypothetical protein
MIIFKRMAYSLILVNIMRVGIKWETIRMIKSHLLSATSVARRNVLHKGKVQRSHNYHKYFSFPFIMATICPGVNWC